MIYITINGIVPKYMEDMFSQHAGYLAYNLRASCKNVALPRAKTDYYRNGFAFTRAKLWNSLPNDIKGESFIKAFIKKLSQVGFSITI